ncbi:DUF1707 SHOCT-like domain-containing protein [Nocardia sp. NBC_00416]|uniref:DUF1707 SHOCT-like domain-containing protein n=1 Tax=Nocardia sp. NBC_00416 TaxID=2975991 RepID=UPI002E1C5263
MATNELRARDSDRSDTCGLLDTALADGQLTAGEHEQRTAAAMRAKSFGELDALIEDLQIPGELASTPVVVGRRRAPRWRVTVGVVVAALAFGAVGGFSSRGDDSPGPRSVQPDTTTAAGIARFVEAYRAEFGDTVADEFSFYPDHASFDRYDPGTGVRTSYNFRDGAFDEWTTSTSRDADERTVDVAKIDLAALAGLLAGAPRTLNAQGGAVSHISVEYETSGHADAEPIVQVFVDNAAKSDRGWFDLAFDGEPLDVRPID